ncbi:methylated-DNA--[protein]-cysteine S-methyltransferase [Pseudooceanicola sp. 200-1SW]|uniref:methylated-DNA--[protein]-cysteine S-methyltransferase n=1 Tax=Pseudooceanicola sp. 200-1SW TaxID=3425949 RepID=UPI003D7F5A1D
MTCLSLDTPTGRFWLRASDGAITAAAWHPLGPEAPSPLLEEAAAQIRAYYAGQRQDFDLPLRVTGGAFQQAVCAEIAAIPFGQTRTYGELARRLDRPAQAVGQGCGGNPIPLLIPCHRVLSATGLGEFSSDGGIETKVWLLKHEGAAGLLI